MTQKEYTETEIPITSGDEYWYRSEPQAEIPMESEPKDTEPVGANGVRPSDKPEPVLKDGLPWQAYALVIDRADPRTWYLPHHTKMVKKSVKGKIGYEHTVDWKAMPRIVYGLSRYGRQAEKLPLDENQVLQAASHLAMHYIKAGKPLPDALAVIAYIG